MQVKTVQHSVNPGKTEALKTGFAQTTGEIVNLQDADLEYDPADIGEVIAPISRAKPMLCMDSDSWYEGQRWCCVSVTMWQTVIRNMNITSRTFGFKIEVTAKIAELNFAIFEAGRTYQEGKKIGLADGIAALWYIFTFNVFCSLKASYRLLPGTVVQGNLLQKPIDAENVVPD